MLFSESKWLGAAKHHPNKQWTSSEILDWRLQRLDLIKRLKVEMIITKASPKEYQKC